MFKKVLEYAGEYLSLIHIFKAFQQAIEDYSSKAGYYQDKVCRVSQSVNLTFTEGAFVFLVPVVLFLAPGALADGDFARCVEETGIIDAVLYRYVDFLNRRSGFQRGSKGICSTNGE